MGGKLSHSMSDTEGMGGTPFHRPVSPYEDMLPQSGNPDLSSQLMGLACHFGLSLFQSACPQRGYFLSVRQSLCICVVETGRGPPGWVTGWVSKFV